MGCFIFGTLCTSLFVCFSHAWSPVGETWAQSREKINLLPPPMNFRYMAFFNLDQSYPTNPSSREEVVLYCRDFFKMTPCSVLSTAKKILALIRLYVWYCPSLDRDLLCSFSVCHRQFTHHYWWTRKRHFYLRWFWTRLGHITVRFQCFIYICFLRFFVDFAFCVFG